MDFNSLREKMIDTQICGRGVRDEKVLQAMRNVAREKFVLPEDVARSYEDGPLPIGCGQTISQPYIVAYMTELLELTGNESVLEIGTGSGYQTAVLAEIARAVYTIEVIESLLEQAREILEKELRYNNIHCKHGNGRNGWPERAPFDRIIVTAAPETFPVMLFEQLVTGGIAVAPVGHFFQTMVRYTKTEHKVHEEKLIGVSFVPFV